MMASARTLMAAMLFLAVAQNLATPVAYLENSGIETQPAISFTTFGTTMLECTAGPRNIVMAVATSSVPAAGTPGSSCTCSAQGIQCNVKPSPPFNINTSSATLAVTTVGTVLAGTTTSATPTPLTQSTLVTAAAATGGGGGGNAVATTTIQTVTVTQAATPGTLNPSPVTTVAPAASTAPRTTNMITPTTTPLGGPPVTTPPPTTMASGTTAAFTAAPIPFPNGAMNAIVNAAAAAAAASANAKTKTKTVPPPTNITIVGDWMWCMRVTDFPNPPKTVALHTYEAVLTRQQGFINNTDPFMHIMTVGPVAGLLPRDFVITEFALQGHATQYKKPAILFQCDMVTQNTIITNIWEKHAQLYYDSKNENIFYP